MRNRLFTIIDGDPVIEAPLVNLKAFRELWMLDKSDDKSEYKKWMLYIYYMYDYESEFYELADKEEQVCLEIFNKKKIKIPKQLEACIKEYKSKNVPVEQRTLDAAIRSADNVTSNLTKLQQNVEQLDALMTALEKEISNALKAGETMVAVELTKEKLTIQKTQLDLVDKSSSLIPKIEKSVNSIISLRSAVEKAVSNDKSNNTRLENYLIDEFINEAQLRD